MKNKLLTLAFVLVGVVTWGQGAGGFGVSAAAGTDLSLGLAWGGGASYLMVQDEAASVELAANLFHSSYEETSVEYGNTYYDEGNSWVYAVVLNSLFQYHPRGAGTYSFVGIGAGAVALEWKKHSTDDPTYNDSGDSSGTSLVLNAGVGWTMGNGFELRLQLPVFVTFTALGTGFAPALTAGAGFRW